MSDDEDRAAILRRRQRFIFLALSGLTGAAGCEEPAPTHGLPEVVREQPMVEQEPAAPPADEAVEELAASEPDEPYVADPSEVRHAEDAKRRARRPQVRPYPCLTRLPSRTNEITCLWMKPDPEEDV